MTRNSTDRRFVLGLLLVVGGAAASSTAEAGTIKSAAYGDWALHINDSAAGKLCFIASEPKGKTATMTNRTPAILYISAWPKDGVNAELSIKQGYKIKPGSKVAVSVGPETFKLFPQDERAFVADAALEAKLLVAMKKGATLTVQASPERGDVTTDTYSLNGLSQALQALAEACR
jgi:invasion protein IalB